MTPDKKLKRLRRKIRNLERQNSRLIKALHKLIVERGS